MEREKDKRISQQVKVNPIDLQINDEIAMTPSCLYAH